MNFAEASLWASLPVPALVIDSEDRIEEANPTAEQVLNASAKALRGQYVWDKLTVDAPLKEALARLRRDRTTLLVNNVEIVTPGRASFEGSLQMAPMVDDPERLILLFSSHEIAERLEQAESMRSAAKSAIGMAEMLAHEIKNPLAGITGAAQLLSMSVPAEDRELTDLIVEESRRIVKLLEQVEQFGNLQPPAKQSVNIHDILDRARHSSILGYCARMTIRESYDPSLPPTYGDADQLLQVFLNLLKNAAEAAPQGGTITLRTFYDHSLRLRRKDGQGVALPLTVEVIDDGPGISPDIVSDIFDPFVSGRENGTGLGLALVSKIISEHDAWIGVDSTPGHTVFRISLPMAPKPYEIEGS